MRSSLRLLVAPAVLALACASESRALVPLDGAGGPSDGSFDASAAPTGDAAPMAAPAPAEAATDAAGDAEANAVDADGGRRPCRATEVCNNGLDDDCNGLVDDRCACLPGDRSP
jgi:hypothetical protein